MAITYDAGANLITVDGGSESFATIYAADVAGGWGVVEQLTSRNHLVKCGVFLTGGGDFWIGYSNHELVEFNYTSCTQLNSLQFSGEGRLFIGRWDGGTGYSNNYGASIKGNTASNTLNRISLTGDVRISNSSFYNIYYSYINGTVDTHAVIQNTKFVDFNFGLGTNQYTDIYNSSSSGGFYGGQFSGIGELDGFTCFNNNIGFLSSYTEDMTMRNCKFGNIISGLYTYMRVGRAERTWHYVDCEIPKSGLGVYISGILTTRYEALQLLESTFSFDITNQSGTPFEGANITLYDASSNVHYTGVTDASGNDNAEIAYYSRNYITEATVLVSDDKVDYEPFKLVVSKEGHEDLTINDINVTMAQPTKLLGELKPLQLRLVTF